MNTSNISYNIANGSVCAKIFSTLQTCVTGFYGLDKLTWKLSLVKSVEERLNDQPSQVEMHYEMHEKTCDISQRNVYTYPSQNVNSFDNFLTIICVCPCSVHLHKLLSKMADGIPLILWKYFAKIIEMVHIQWEWITCNVITHSIQSCSILRIRHYHIYSYNCTKFNTQYAKRSIS